MTVLKGEKLYLIHEFGSFKQLGTCMEVANITDTSVVLRHDKTKVAITAIDIKDLDKYFTKDKNKWSDWSNLIDETGELIGTYRTNHKKVQVRTLFKKFRGESSCNVSDKFNINFGIRMAYLRARIKFVLSEIEKYNKELNDIKSEMDSMMNYINSKSKE